MADLLDMDYINSLPHPLWVECGEGAGFPVHDIEVQTGLFRVDVCGMLDVCHIGSVITFRDCDGKTHYADDFYNDPESWIDRTPSAAKKD